MFEFKEVVLVKSMDIEDLVKFGELSRACLYYVVCLVLLEVDLVLMFYVFLLYVDMCEILGVKLENVVVVFDEAYNLVDVVYNLYGVAVMFN